MNFSTGTNENTDLAYYQSDFQTLSGINPIDTKSMLASPEFNAVSAAIYGKSVSQIPTMKVIQITLNPSYIPDFLRYYMAIAGTYREAYTPEKKQSYWVPEFQKNGFDPEITRILFDEFYNLYKAGAVPRSIWMPDKKTVTIPGQNGNGNGNGPSKTPWGLIGGGVAAVIGIGAAIYLMKS